MTAITFRTAPIPAWQLREDDRIVTDLGGDDDRERVVENVAGAHRGHVVRVLLDLGLRLPAGRYEVAVLDGTDGELFLFGPNDRELVQANPGDPNITIEEN